jgi:Suppressor of fused protein (SUFU)
MNRSDLLRRVETHLVAAFGPDTGRASVTFLGAEEIAVLRFGEPPGGADGPVARYATVGMSATPMGDPAQGVVDETAPRAELVLSLRSPRDSVARRLAVLAAIPAVEGIPVAPGAALELGETLWDGAPFTAVLVGDPGGLIPDLVLSGGGLAPVRFLPVHPMTAREAAFKRARGADELRRRWLLAGTDLRDPARRDLALDG